MLQQVDDVAAVLDFVRQNADSLRVNTQKLSIIGHSLGGFTAIRAAAENKELVCVVGLAAANLGEWADEGEQKTQEFLEYTDQLIMLNNYNRAKALAELNADAESLDLRNLAGNFAGRSVLLITGDKDDSVPADVQARIVTVYEKTPGIILTAEVIPGDHSFSSSRIRLQRMVIAWMSQNCR